ncbi:hypothetical protein [Cupriavidus sp. 2KB_15]|uniref:hypothetical protein n=1 Tax=Cupriavidus sp. 2KB_15 TaxID=3232976 RepID=UPI003F93F4FF
MDKAKVPTDQRAAHGLLADDHRAAKKLFKQFEESSSISCEVCVKNECPILDHLERIRAQVALAREWAAVTGRCMRSTRSAMLLTHGAVPWDD